MPSVAGRYTPSLFWRASTDGRAEEQPVLQDALDLLHKGKYQHAWVASKQCLQWATASSTPAKQRTVKLSSIVHVICQHAFEHGLDQDALRYVVQLASVKTSLDQTSVTTLIKSLYPAHYVPGDVVVAIVGALGQGNGKPSPATQDSLIKWLTTVHEIIEDSNVLSRLYCVLFGMLDMISIRCVTQVHCQHRPVLILEGPPCVICSH